MTRLTDKLHIVYFRCRHNVPDWRCENPISPDMSQNDPPGGLRKAIHAVGDGWCPLFGESAEKPRFAGERPYAATRFQGITFKSQCASLYANTRES